MTGFLILLLYPQDPDTNNPHKHNLVTADNAAILVIPSHFSHDN